MLRKGEPMKDPIERQDAIDTVFKFLGKREIARTIQTALWILPSAQQDCTECEDYDHETKSCPKYCDVIRRTVEEAKQKRTGRWMATEADEPCFYRCSECGRMIDERENFCPDCGAKMEGTE